MIEQASTSLLIAAMTGDFTGGVAYGIEGARVLGILRYSRLHEGKPTARDSDCFRLSVLTQRR